MKDPHTQESRGFGFVKMVTAEEADAAKDGLQGESIEGRTLSIEKARRARPRTPTPGKYFGPPKRGMCSYPLFFSNTNYRMQMTISGVLPVVAALTDMMIAAVAAATVDTAVAVMVAAAMMIITVVLGTMTVTLGHQATRVATITALGVSIAMHPAATIAIAAEMTTTVVAAGTTPLVTVDVDMGTHPQETHILEVETMTFLPTIGTPVVRAAR